MRKNYQKSTPIKFLIFLLAIIVMLIIYISSPDDNQKKNEKKTYQEMLEYSNRNNNNSEKKAIKKEVKEQEYLPGKKSDELLKKQEIQENLNSTKENYDKLLDDITQYPLKNKTTVTYIINKILTFKGYPKDIIKVISTDIDQSKSKMQNSYNAANFDFKTGNLYLSEKILYDININTLTAILVHELDHFDKLAKICKNMGLERFKNLFRENDIDIDTIFWSKAALYADTKNFNSEYYEKALERYITQNNLELISSYSDFYRLSENMRNPLEISAYQASDYVYNHYNIKITDGPMKKMTQKFNDVDWAIYNAISQNQFLKTERIAIFDYFFLKAILSQYPEFKEQFYICINNKNGDLTTFWLAFENSVKSFYQKGQMDNETYEKMLNLLNKTEDEAKKGITPTEGLTALKYKINTLASNLVYPNAINNLKSYCVNYLNYLKKENISDEEQELKCILILLCIENELYTNNNEKEISLYYLNFPEEIYKIYNIQNKKKKYLFIYNNSAFKNKLTETEAEQALLENLLNQNRLDVKINS